MRNLHLWLKLVVSLELAVVALSSAVPL